MLLFGAIGACIGALLRLQDFQVLPLFKTTACQHFSGKITRRNTSGSKSCQDLTAILVKTLGSGSI